MKEQIKIAYHKELEEIQKKIQKTEKVYHLNELLQGSNWLFINPYNFGYEIIELEKLVEEKTIDENKVFEIYARSFFDLRTTSAFVEGFYKKRPHIKDFIYLIDQSVILALQKDFAGAIIILIPVIEGSIRKYLVSKGKNPKKIINIEELKKIKFYLLADYVELQLSFLENKYFNLKEQGHFFDKNHIKKITNKHKEYFGLWIDQFLNYLENNLYLDTRKGEVVDKLNRNIILHGFETDIKYSFSNFLRIFNCLNFISWMYGEVNKECLPFADAEEEAINKRLIQYTKILIVSESLTETKNNIYGNLEDAEINYIRYIPYHFSKPLSILSKKIEKILKTVEGFFN